MNLIMLFVAIAAGVVFYSVRCRKPFWYGCAEALVGIAVICIVLYPVETNYLLLEAGEPSGTEVWISKATGVLAGIYVLVRGLDNMSRDLPPRWVPWWRRFFPSGRGYSLSRLFRLCRYRLQQRALRIHRHAGGTQDGGAPRS
jgi:hypothetical protein